MKRNNGDHGMMAIGAPSVIMIFVVLCLTCFAVLSLVSANADMRLARRTAENTAAYYAADAAAQRRLVALEGADADALDPDEFTVEWANGEAYATFYTPITDATALQTKARLTGGAPVVVVNRTVITAELAYTELPDIWDGELPDD